MRRDAARRVRRRWADRASVGIRRGPCVLSHVRVARVRASRVGRPASAVEVPASVEGAASSNEGARSSPEPAGAHAKSSATSRLRPRTACADLCGAEHSISVALAPPHNSAATTTRRARRPSYCRNRTWKWSSCPGSSRMMPVRPRPGYWNYPRAARPSRPRLSISVERRPKLVVHEDVLDRALVDPRPEQVPLKLDVELIGRDLARGTRRLRRPGSS